MKYHNIKSYEEFFMVDTNEPLYIVEGININSNDKTISLTDEHDKGVDFSLVNNPVYDKYKDFDLISIFKRSKLLIRIDYIYVAVVFLCTGCKR